MSATLANSPAFWIALIGALAALYLLPILIALLRHAEDLWLIVFLHVLPTQVGWRAAMLLACMNPRREPPEPHYHWEGYGR